MATDTATKQNDTPTSPKTTRAKRTPKPRAKTAAKSRSRSRTAATSRKPAARTSRTETRSKTVQNGGRQVFAGVIDAQEKTLTALADYQTRAAELSQIPGAAAIAGAQAQLLRGATDVYISAARSLLK
jgi:hypothetical protein